MPSVSLPTISNNIEDSPISIYVPVHYDFSQIEYVAPFLEHYKGSKVFIYKWNGIREKIHDYYLNSLEYKKANLGVYDFTLKNILKAIFDEPLNRKVVFLLTSSMAYAFGAYQRMLLNEVKATLEKVAMKYELDPQSSEELKTMAKALKTKIWGVSVIGHCMYGCMSCKGNDHKVPVYFTRYFNKNIPYKKEDIESQFALSSNPISVLCAPSTGETSLLLQNEILDYLLELQNQGHFKFVWKFHPSVYNQANYSTNTKEDELEIKNVKWIIKHFQCTKESEPCLLPFLEAFQIIFCDLHSSVPFIASYFSPKTIICYWNDADYEVPAGRDPAFLANLHVYQHPAQLKNLLRKDHVPDPLGDRTFFHRMYGHVDGTEVVRYAHIAQWPTIAASPSLTDAPPMHLYRHTLSETAQAWAHIYRDAQQTQRAKPVDPPPDEDAAEEVKLAMGIMRDIPLDLLTSLEAEACVSKTRGNAGPPIQFSVMTCNLWLGCEGCYSVDVLAGQRWSEKSRFPTAAETTQLLTHLAQSILSANVDLLCCQECASLARDSEDHEPALVRGEVEGRVDQLTQLQSILQHRSGLPWYVHHQGILTPGKGNRHPWGLLSKYPITSTPGRFGVTLEVHGQKVMVLNTHLPYTPYAPYQLVRPSIPYEDTPAFTTAHEAIHACRCARERCMEALLVDLDTSLSQEDVTLVVVTGDFNEPSHLDWTWHSVIAGYHPMCVTWPMTEMLAKRHFKDCYRTLYPDTVRYPGYTWCSYKEEFDGVSGLKEGAWRLGKEERDKMERIDFIFYKSDSDKWEVKQVEIMGNSKTALGRSLLDDTLLHLPVENEDWISDHRSVIARFSFDSLRG